MPQDQEIHPMNIPSRKYLKFMKDAFKLISWPPEFLVEKWFTRIHGHKCWDLLFTMEWSSPAHYGKLGDAPKIIGRVRSFQAIKVWGGRLNNLKRKCCSTDTFWSLLWTLKHEGVTIKSCERARLSHTHTHTTKVTNSWALEAAVRELLCLVKLGTCQNFCPFPTHNTGSSTMISPSCFSATLEK